MRNTNPEQSTRLSRVWACKAMCFPITLFGFCVFESGVHTFPQYFLPPSLSSRTITHFGRFGSFGGVFLLLRFGCALLQAERAAVPHRTVPARRTTWSAWATCTIASAWRRSGRCISSWTTTTTATSIWPSRMTWVLQSCIRMQPRWVFQRMRVCLRLSIICVSFVCSPFRK